jgi:hypothetical protein
VPDYRTYGVSSANVLRARAPAAILCSVGLHLAAGYWLVPVLRPRPPPDSLPLPAPTGDTLAWADFALATPASAPPAAAPRVVVQIQKNPKNPPASHDPNAPVVSPTGALAAEARRRLENDQLGDAMVTLRQCLQSEPQNAECHLMMGKVFGGRQDYAGEAIEYRAFLRYAPSNHPARWWAQQILDDHDFTEEGVAAVKRRLQK